MICQLYPHMGHHFLHLLVTLVLSVFTNTTHPPIPILLTHYIGHGHTLYSTSWHQQLESVPLWRIQPQDTNHEQKPNANLFWKILEILEKVIYLLVAWATLTHQISKIFEMYQRPYYSDIVRIQSLYVITWASRNLNNISLSMMLTFGFFEGVWKWSYRRAEFTQLV